MTTLRVLVVEDSPTDAKLVVEELRRGGWTIQHARVQNATEMRAALERSAWDAVISDWSMPQFSAAQALALVKERALDVPFIIVSGTMGEDSAVDAMRAGAHDYVLKDRLSRLGPAVEREVREHGIREAQRQSARAFRASEARYRRIVETTSQGVWLIDAAGKTTFANERLAAMLGCEADQLIGASPNEFLDGDGPAAFAHTLAQRRAAASIQAEVRLIRRDGGVRWAIIDAAPLDDGAIAMVADVTERRAATQALFASEARFRRLWDAGIVLLTISDRERRIKDINDAGARMLGFGRDELLASRIRWDAMTPSDWNEADEAARAELATQGVARPYEKELFRKDGSRVAIVAAAAALDDDERLSIAIDVTSQKRAENELRERVRIASLVADVASALVRDENLRDALQRCTDALVEHLGAALARIWTVDRGKAILELQASAGLSTRTDGAYACVRIGALEIGRVAAERAARFVDQAPIDGGLDDPGWAQSAGLTSFAGHPLLVGGEVVGVVAMFARARLTEPARKGITAIADAIALGIHRSVVKNANLALEAQLRQAQKMEAIGRLAAEWPTTSTTSFRSS